MNQRTSPSKSLDNKISKFKLSTQERDYYESLSDLYSILLTAEQIERAYLKSSIAEQQYTQLMLGLISQFRTFKSLMPDLDIKNFMIQYDLSCPAAYKRLVEIGLPATIEHSIQAPNSLGSQSKMIAETVQFFITLMDSLKLNVVAVDEVHPQLSDLIQTLNKVSVFNKSLEPSKGKEKIKEWLIKLNRLKASDELNDDQVRQLLFDLESAYAEFQHSLST